MSIWRHLSPILSGHLHVERRWIWSAKGAYVDLVWLEVGFYEELEFRQHYYWIFEGYYQLKRVDRKLLASVASLVKCYVL